MWNFALTFASFCRLILIDSREGEGRLGPKSLLLVAWDTDSPPVQCPFPSLCFALKNQGSKKKIFPPQTIPLKLTLLRQTKLTTSSALFQI